MAIVLERPAAPIRRFLRGVPGLYSLNAHLKAQRTRAEYDRLYAAYAGRPAPAPFEALLRERVGSRAARLHRDRPSIFFLGTDELQDRSGILQALEALGEVTCFTRADGSYGQNAPGPRLVRRQANTERLEAMFRTRAAEGHAPDILIAQTWADFVDPAAFDRLADRYGTVVINIAMDDRHQFLGRPIDDGPGGTRGLIGHIDLALTAAPECVDWYLKEGCPALFFPEASDPDLFRPMPDLPKLHDVCFVGTRYGVRDDLVGRLRRAGVKVAAYGTGWETGRIDAEAVPQLFAQSRIVLGIGTIGHCRDFFALKLRDFDGPMSGTFYLTHANPDLARLYRIGEEIETYVDIEDCIVRVLHFLHHDDERERVAAAGRVRAARDHTWDKRFRDLFGNLASLAPPTGVASAH